MPGCKVFVQHLALAETTQDEVKEYFEQCGSVVDIFWPKRARHLMAQNTLTVSYAQPEQAARACLELNRVTMYTRSMGAIIKANNLLVSAFIENPKNPSRSERAPPPP